eukprot:UN1021
MADLKWKRARGALRGPPPMPAQSIPAFMSLQTLSATQYDWPEERLIVRLTLAGLQPSKCDDIEAIVGSFATRRFKVGLPRHCGTMVQMHVVGHAYLTLPDIDYELICSVGLTFFRLHGHLLPSEGCAQLKGGPTVLM